jgi:Mn2+/Fe2+ NRAMP family transporter
VKIGIPLPKLIHSIIFVVGTLIVLAVPNSRKWEAWECFNALLVFLIFIDPFNLDERLIE